MRLDQELVRRKLVSSRTEAQELISTGCVLINNIVCTKQIKQVNESDNIVLTSQRQFVSRGGEKLQGILHDIFVDDKNINEFCNWKTAVDIGSSTGGFTDCLLYYGVEHVDDVDVGTLQLHEKLRNNSKVSVYENTDIRNFNLNKTYDIVVADLSFIKLSHVIDDIIRLSKEGAHCFLLIKPQFEVGRGNTKKGIVKDKKLVEEILLEYKKLVEEKGVTSIKIIPCHLQGGDGNQEYFLYGIAK